MLKISTTKLQELISKAIKGVGNNKLIPRTTDIAIRVKDNVLTLITSDDDNFLNIRENIESDDFYAVVQADQFSKLVMRTTSENITLERKDSILELKGNGTYTFSLEMDENTGDVVEYPDPSQQILSIQQTTIGKIDVSTIRTILGAIKPSVAITDDIPTYTNYYFGDVVLATDTFKIGCLAKKITATPILVSAKLMELLDVYGGETPMDIYKADGRLVFHGDSCTVCGYAIEGIESFAVDSIMAYMDKEYPSKCVLPKQAVLQLLDRLSLFVGAFDDGVVDMAFTGDGLQVSSQKSDSVEILPYVDSALVEDSVGRLYLEMFRAQVKAQTGDNIQLYFGDNKSLKLVDDNINVTSIVSLVV